MDYSHFVRDKNFFMQVKMHPEWVEILKSEFDKEYFVRLTHFVKEEYSKGICYPPGPEIFNAFDLCPPEKVKVVILGQDPYHGPGQAEGLCFSVKTGMPLPPSLVNIFKEIKNDLGTVPEVIRDANGRAMYDGSLRRWAEQGVLLLNATLTVRQHQAASHQKQGWEQFTDAVITAVSSHCQHVAFLLWGGYARSKAQLIDRQRHLVLESVHPSPLSANRGGWFGNHHFSLCNAWLVQHGMEPIAW